MSSDDDDYYNGENPEDFENLEEDVEALTEEEKRVRRELADIPFDQLLEIKEKMGKKAFDKSLSAARVNTASSLKKGPSHRPSLKKENRPKNAPVEISSKRPVKVLRTIVKEDKPKAHDPRFDQRAGQMKYDLYKKAYGFIDDYKRSEVEDLENRIKQKKHTDGTRITPEERDEMKNLLISLKSKAKSDASKEKREAILKEHKKKEREMSKKGKTPFFLKKSEVKKLELVSKYKDIKAKKGDHADHVLEKLMEKKRKKNAGKQKKLIPFASRTSKSE